MTECIPVVMIHHDIVMAPQTTPFTKQYYCVPYQFGDAEMWSQLQTSTDSFAIKHDALVYFEKEFGGDEAALKSNCFFLKNVQGQYIGSAMAWHSHHPFDQSYGRLHWVVIHPDHRGKGLGKKLVSFTLNKLKSDYSKVYLTTQTTSLRAIYIYLDFGFRPSIKNDQDVRAWTLIGKQLQHPELGPYQD